MVNVDDRCSAVVLRPSQDSPARTASVTNPTASALPTGPGFTDKEWPITVGLPSRRATRSLPAPKEVPHHPQKRFSCRLACWHRGHGVCSAMWSAYPPRRVFSPLYTSLRHHPPSRLDLRTGVLLGSRSPALANRIRPAQIHSAAPKQGVTAERNQLGEGCQDFRHPGCCQRRVGLASIWVYKRF